MIWLCLTASFAADLNKTPQPQEQLQRWQKPGLGWGGIPAVNYSSDEGLGFGVVGSIYQYDGTHKPYKSAWNLVIFTTTLGVQRHNLQWDHLDLFDKPIRLTIRGEFQSVIASNYCGTGNQVTCSAEVATAEADRLGLTGDEREEFESRFYKVRLTFPNLRANARFLLKKTDTERLEAIVGYRSLYLIPGTLNNPTPYPGSSYDLASTGGESGLTSTVQFGLTVDSRDIEPAPTQGHWYDVTVRASNPLWLSQYTNVGFNATFRNYTRFGSERLVWANRVMLDGLAGEANLMELAMPGGLQRYYFFGGLNAGRGVRQRRYLGRYKAMEQAELRWIYAKPRFGDLVIDLTVLGFADVGFVGIDGSELSSMWQKPLPGYGGGLRFAFNKNFVVRADMGFSAFEDGPLTYIDIRNTF